MSNKFLKYLLIYLFVMYYLSTIVHIYDIWGNNYYYTLLPSGILLLNLLPFIGLLWPSISGLSRLSLINQPILLVSLFSHIICICTYMKESDVWFLSTRISNLTSIIMLTILIIELRE